MLAQTSTVRPPADQDYVPSEVQAPYQQADGLASQTSDVAKPERAAHVAPTQAASPAPVPPPPPPEADAGGNRSLLSDDGGLRDRDVAA